MALDPKYVVTSDVDTYFVDKDTGVPLANGTLTFYRDTARNVPKPIYQLTGSPPSYSYVELPNPLTLSSVGTVQNAAGDNVVIYYYPYDEDGNLDLYYVVGQDQGGVEQFTREAWPNIAASSSPINTDNIQRENQLSNPTFTNVFLNEGIPTTFAVSGFNQVFPIGPDWDMIISGSGSVSVQRIAVTGNEKVVSSPPYVLDVQVGVGITTCFLRQRFAYNSGLWASTADYALYLAGSIVARNQGVGTTNVSMFYQDGTGSPIQIFSGSVAAGNYQFISGESAQIPQSGNLNSGASGYVDITVVFTPASEVRISCVQLIPSVGAALTSVPLDLNSSDRDEAFQGDWYIPRLNTKRIPSYLVGWDFPLNPFQELGTGPHLVGANQYIADQTILILGSAVPTTQKDSVTSGLQIFTGGGNQTLYLTQYLSGDIVKEIITNRLSVNIFGYKTAGTGTITGRIYLLRGNAASPGPAATFPILPIALGNVDASGIFSLTAANWTIIPRGNPNFPVPQFNFNSIPNDFGFSGWQITDPTQLGNTDKFAIIVTLVFSDTSTVVLNDISLVPGDIPCRSGVKSSDEVLRQCQYYYQKSFFPEVVPTTGIPGGQTIAPQVVGASTASIGPVIRFPVLMQDIPSVTLFNPAAANSQIRNNSIGADWSGTASSIRNQWGFQTTGTTPGGSSAGQGCGIQWTADARLGVV